MDPQAPFGRDADMVALVGVSDLVSRRWRVRLANAINRADREKRAETDVD
jgi:hypothetical protein